MNEAIILWEDTLEAPIRPDFIRVLLVGESMVFEVKKGDDWLPTQLSELDTNLLIRRILSASRSWEGLARAYREKHGPLLCNDCAKARTEDSWYCCSKAAYEHAPLGWPLL